MMMLFTTLLYLVLPASILASDAPCYFPDGSRAFNYTSCSSADVPSHCCSRESICLTNGFCISTVHTYTLTRATCTDSTWPSDVCKNPCSGSTPPPLVTNHHQTTIYIVPT